MPRYRDGFPRPKKEYHHGVWRIIWRWGGKKYSVATTIADKDAISDIESFVRNLAGQLAVKGRPQITSPWRGSPGVERYIADRFGLDSLREDNPSPSSEKWIADYAKEIRMECSKPWAEMSIAHLGSLNAETSGLATLTPESASIYLDILQKLPQPARPGRATGSLPHLTAFTNGQSAQTEPRSIHSPA